MTRLVIVADDLTGACDSAALLHRRGTTSVVLDAAGPWPGHPVVSVDCDSRHRPADEAADRVAAVTGRALAMHAELVKKIDSTLRGNVAVELRAVAEATARVGTRVLLVVAPAFPGTGRTTRDGVVHVGGRRLSAHGSDGDVVRLLVDGGLRSDLIGRDDLGTGRLTGRVVEAYAEGLDAVVVDGETEGDLAAVVAATRGGGVPVVLVGSGGLTRALAGPAVAEEPSAHGPGPALVVVGSHAEASRAQRERLVEQGVRAVVLDEPSATADRVRRALSEGPVVLSPDPAAPVVRSEAASVAQALAETTTTLLGDVGTLVVTGGETARAVLRAAGVDHLRVIGELEPGVVRGHVPHLGLDLVTKAGAFGDRDALLRCLPDPASRPVSIRRGATP
jgi:D-threonate/D-erythronate kinase